MFLARFRHFSQKILFRPVSSVVNWFQKQGFDWTHLLVIACMVGILIMMNFNVYQNISSAVQEYELLQQEKADLDALRKESEELDSELEYYRSLSFRQRYAYDSLNMARPNEDIYLIEPEGRVSLVDLQEEPEPVNWEDKSLWWKLLLQESFGISL